MTRAPEQNPAALYPEDLLTNDPYSKPWRIAHVKSRREKALADFMARQGMGYYLPLTARRQASRNRVRYSLVPLFGGYIFFKADDPERYTAMRTNHIARVIDVRDPETLVSELQNIRKALSGNLPVFPIDYLTPGRPVRIKTGPLKDVEGVVVRKDRNFRLVLSVTSIMQAISVEVEADMVVPL